jgi:hypothetical protein
MRLGLAAVLAAAGLLLTGWGAFAQPKAEPRLRLVPPSVDVVEGQVVVDLTLTDAPTSSGFSADLLFDGDRLAVVGVALGPWPGSTGRAVQPLGPTLGPGRLALGALMVGEQPGPDGAGVLATITFAPLDDGAVRIEIENPTLVGADGSVIPVTAEGADVAITQPPSEEGVAHTAATATALAAAPRSGLVGDFVAAVEAQATAAAPGRAVPARTSIATFTPIRGGGDPSGSQASGGTALIVIALVVAGVVFAWVVLRRGA